MQIFKLSPTAFSLIFASNAVGLIGAAQVNRWLTRHYDTHAILRAASLGNVLTALLLPVLVWTGIGGFPAFFADIFLCLMTVGLILPNATAAVMAPFPETAGVASALLGMLQFSVGATTGALVGLFHDGTARPMAFVMAGCAAVSFLITILTEKLKAPIRVFSEV
jgi:MFS transporter, DHA1 family, multidrug resistance protein